MTDLNIIVIVPIGLSNLINSIGYLLYNNRDEGQSSLIVYNLLALHNTIQNEAIF